MTEKDYRVDMHIHTNASDGTWTVVEVLERIIKNNIKLFSITDHNTIENSINMLNYVPDNLDYVMGVEFSCTYNDQEYHITAYDFDYKNDKLNELIEFNQIQVKEYNAKIIEFTKKIDKIKNTSDYFSYSYDRKRGGWDSLNYLIDKNVVRDFSEYFEIIRLSKEKLYFKNPEEVIEIVKNAGGHSFLAHPSAYVKGDKLPVEILGEWINYGVSGIECFSPYLENIENADYYIKFCSENNLMISAGSDCHGEFNDRVLGIPKVSIDKLKLDF